MDKAKQIDCESVRIELTNNVLAAINEIESMLTTIKPENLPGKEVYNYPAEQSECIQSRIGEILDALERLKNSL